MFERPKIQKEKVQQLLADLLDNIEELRSFQKMTLEEFQQTEHSLAITSTYLMHALEDIFSIGLHILSRTPDVKLSGEYGAILPLLAEKKIIPEEYAKRNEKMSKYRNRLVHHYHDITEKEMHGILNEHLDDLEKFAQYIQKVLKNQ